MTALVTGGCGFVGSNVAARLLDSGERVVVCDDLSRLGSETNLRWLMSKGNVEFHRVDIRDADAVASLVSVCRPSMIFHLAGQVAMTISMGAPRRDFETNALGSFNLLEAVRLHCPRCPLVYASTNKVYGALAEVPLQEERTRYVAPLHPYGVDESARLDFQTPYGCSKGAADQYVLDYARAFGLDTVVFRHSTIYGGRQFASYDQGWVGWFCSQAIVQKRVPAGAPFSISGDGKQVRDLLFVDDAVDAYLAAVTHISRARGMAFNIGGGIRNSSSLLELFDQLESLTGTPLRWYQAPWRDSDQRFFVADTRSAERVLGWVPRVDKASGVARMLEWAESLASPGASTI